MFHVARSNRASDSREHFECAQILKDAAVAAKNASNWCFDLSILQSASYTTCYFDLNINQLRLLSASLSWSYCLACHRPTYCLIPSLKAPCRGHSDHFERPHCLLVASGLGGQPCPLPNHSSSDAMIIHAVTFLMVAQPKLVDNYLSIHDGHHILFLGQRINIIPFTL